MPVKAVPKEKFLFESGEEQWADASVHPCYWCWVKASRLSAVQFEVQ